MRVAVTAVRMSMGSTVSEQKHANKVDKEANNRHKEESVMMDMRRMEESLDRFFKNEE